MATDGRLRVLLAPPEPWGPARKSFVDGEGPDPFALDRNLLAEGIEAVVVDPAGRPWNPLAGRGSVLHGMDPWRALHVLARERKADLVVPVFESAAVPLTFLRGLARFPVPIALWDIGLTEGWAFRERVQDFIVPRVDGIMVLGSNQIDYIRRRWNPPGLLQNILHRVDERFFAAAPARPEGPIVSIGDDPGRDYACLAEAIRGLDLPVRVKTRRGRAAFGDPLDPNVSIIDGWLTPVQLRDLYQSASIVVVPVTETLNASGVSAALEAMATGRPTIISDSAALRDYTVPGETCLVVPCGDAAALRAAILRLRGDPDLAARLGANGRTLVEQRFGERPFARTFAAAIRRIVEGHAARRRG